MKFQEPISGLIERMALALERLGPIRPEKPDFSQADAFVFQAETEAFTPIKDINRVPLALLKGIDRMGARTRRPLGPRRLAIHSGPSGRLSAKL